VFAQARFDLFGKPVVPTWRKDVSIADRRTQSIEGRFSTPAYNGDTLRTEIWLGGDGAGAPGVRFRVRNGEGAVVVDRGAARCV